MLRISKVMFVALLLLGTGSSQSKRHPKLSAGTPTRNQKGRPPVAQPAATEEDVHRIAPPHGEGAAPQARGTGVDSTPSRDMKLAFLKNTKVTCNDGTTAGYYIREQRNSKRWIVFLEGGWCCYNAETCESRHKYSRRLTSSSEWPQTRKGTGILSAQVDENPYWWSANAVFVPYCSSDIWTGTLPKSRQASYAFMGSLIIQEVIKDLVPKGIKQAKVVMLAGSRMWNGILPEKCKQQFKRGEEWQCFLGYKLYSSLKSPVFVVQWLFDEEQLKLENIHLGSTSVLENWRSYTQNLGRELRNSLRDIPAVFAPSCLAHTLVTKSYWTEIQVKGVPLPRALQCWGSSLSETGRPLKPSLRSCPFRLIDGCSQPHCNPTCPAVQDPARDQEA